VILTQMTALDLPSSSMSETRRSAFAASTT
jgi:hypothetical protein